MVLKFDIWGSKWDIFFNLAMFNYGNLAEYIFYVY